MRLTIVLPLLLYSLRPDSVSLYNGDQKFVIDHINLFLYIHLLLQRNVAPGGHFGNAESHYNGAGRDSVCVIPRILLFHTDSFVPAAYGPLETVHWTSLKYGPSAIDFCINSDRVILIWSRSNAFLII